MLLEGGVASLNVDWNLLKNTIQEMLKVGDDVTNIMTISVEFVHGKIKKLHI